MKLFKNLKNKIIILYNMEQKYYCECCNYNAKIKGNYNKHLKSQKHLLKSTQSQQKSTMSQPKVNKKSTICII